MTKAYDTNLRVSPDSLVAIVGSHGIEPTDPILRTIAEVVTFSTSSLKHKLIPNSHRPSITMKPTPPQGTIAHELLAAHVSVAASRCMRNNDIVTVNSVLDEIGFANLAVRMAGSKASIDAFNALSDIVSDAIKTIYDRSCALNITHIKALLARDLGVTSATLIRIPDPAAWALCTHLDGHANRAEIMRRRLQAVEAYGDVTSLLQNASITKAIDEGRQLAPLLCQALNIDAAHLRRITRKRDLVESLTQGDNFAAIRLA